MHALKRSALFLLTTLAISSVPTFSIAKDFTETVKAAAAAAGPGTLAVKGADPNWFFLRRELEHLAVGDLAAATLPVAGQQGNEPVSVIATYAQELKALGVELLLVPVPPKAAIYPEKLDAEIDASTVPSMTPFLDKLKAANVEVLDLETYFKKLRAEQPEQQLYCATDSHWSPLACQLVADLVAQKYQTLAQPAGSLKVLPAQQLEFLGDLISEADKAAMAKEVLPMQRAGKEDSSNPAEVTTVESDPESPVLAIGDSHLQVFRKGGNMLATQGGFIDHLQVKLGQAVEEISMQAGGADGPRRNVARATAANPEFWAKKKVVIWVFTAREFTQGRWMVLPAQVKKK